MGVGEDRRERIMNFKIYRPIWNNTTGQKELKELFEISTQSRLSAIKQVQKTYKRAKFTGVNAWVCQDMEENYEKKK